MRFIRVERGHKSILVRTIDIAQDMRYALIQEQSQSYIKWCTNLTGILFAHKLTWPGIVFGPALLRLHALCSDIILHWEIQRRPETANPRSFSRTKSLRSCLPWWSSGLFNVKPFRRGRGGGGDLSGETWWWRLSWRCGRMQSSTLKPPSTLICAIQLHEADKSQHGTSPSPCPLE